MVVHRQPTPLGASGGAAAYNYDAPSSPASSPSDAGQSNKLAQESSTTNGSANTNDANGAAPSMAEFLGLKELACGAPPALARGAAGAEQMASSVLSFLKCAAGNAGQQVIEKVKSAEDSLLHGDASNMSKESDAADTRDQPDVAGT